MIAKSPDDRYELLRRVDRAPHVRAQQAHGACAEALQPKARVVMETRETKNLTAILSLVLLVAVVGIAVLVYLFRDKIFPEQVLKAGQRPRPRWLPRRR